MGVFVGGSHSSEENGFTLGGEYEFRIHRYFAPGAFGEIVGGDFDEVVFGLQFNLRPVEEWKIFTGPGWDRRFNRGEEGGSTQSSQSGSHSKEFSFLWRAWLMYEIPVSKVTISPTFAVDFLEGHQVFVYGVALGMGF